MQRPAIHELMFACLNVCVIPLCTLLLNRSSLCQVSLPGTTVLYHRPASVFNQALATLTTSITTRSSTHLFIDGASGCGKTRHGCELYCALRLQLAPRRSVAYLYTRFDVRGAAQSVQDMVRQAVVNADGCRSRYEAAAQHLPLQSLLPFLCESASTETLDPAVVVVHIDEFHVDVASTVKLLAAITEFNTLNPHDVLLLPVCTGIVATSAADRIAPSAVITLHYTAPGSWFATLSIRWLAAWECCPQI